MAARDVEIIETGVLGPDVPVSAAAKVGDLVYVSGNLGNRHGALGACRRRHRRRDPPGAHAHGKPPWRRRAAPSTG